MKKFDLKKAILENKATFFSSLTEGYDEFKRADKGSKDVTAKDKGEEEVYGAGVKKGEEIEMKKMKMSELKGKIKKMVMAEMALDIDTMENAPESEVDFLAELEGMLGEDDLYEAEKDEEEEVEVTDEFSTEEPQGPGKIDVTQNADADLTGDKKSVQDNLEAALEAAKSLGDDKLATQIGNSLTFFTKQHVVK
jgi:hypothetical protein